MNDPVSLARDLAEEVLYPAALATDRSELLPRANLDALAAAGLYGMFGPRDQGGYAADLPTAGAIVEQIAGGCLTTALVWMQHHGLVGNLQLGPEELREELLGDLCRGVRRSGIVFTGSIPGPSPLQALPDQQGWIIHGEAPWVSGWGRIDLLQVAARGPDDTVVTVVVDDLHRPGLHPTRQHLAALDATGTVTLAFDRVAVPASRVVHVAPHDPAAAGGARLRLNGSLALGVARRCCELIGSDRLMEELDAVRARLDRAGDTDMAAARAAASAFANRVATILVVQVGSRSIGLDQHAQRLLRESMFLLVFGSRPAIRQALLDRL